MRVQKLMWLPLLAGGIAMAGCTVDKTKDGEMPDVDVSGGSMPEVDVDPATVQVTSDTQQVVTPDVDVVPQ